MILAWAIGEARQLHRDTPVTRAVREGAQMGKAHTHGTSFERNMPQLMRQLPHAVEAPTFAYLLEEGNARLVRLAPRPAGIRLSDR